MPRIDLEELEDGVPTGPRYIDAVAWTKQQPSAEPSKARKRVVEPEAERSSAERERSNAERERSSAERERSSAERDPPSARSSSSSSQRLPRTDAAASQSSSQRPHRPPTAAHPSIEDALPRWLLPLLVMVLLALAYAVYLVWTQ